MIYFVQVRGRDSLVKIGYSKGHPSARVATLQTGCPDELVLIGMLPGSPKEEAAWHRRFAHLRVRGEWFRWAADLRRAAKPHLQTTAERRWQKSVTAWAEVVHDKRCEGWCIPECHPEVEAEIERRYETLMRTKDPASIAGAPTHA